MMDIINAIVTAIIFGLIVGTCLYIFLSCIEFLYKGIKCLDIYIKNNERKNDASEEL